MTRVRPYKGGFMYAGGPLLNLRLLGLFIFETEILLKLLCQQLYFTGVVMLLAMNAYVWLQILVLQLRP